MTHQVINNNMNSTDLFAKWEEERKWKEAHPLLAFPGEAFDFFRYVIPRIVNDAGYAIKWGFQRMFRGYDDPFVWGYWSENAKLQVKVLTRLKAEKHGYPIIIPIEEYWDSATFKEKEGGENKAEAAWEVAMQKMIDGWQAILDEDDIHILDKNGEYDHKKSQTAREKSFATFKRGMKPYVEFYRGLWD